MDDMDDKVLKSRQDKGEARWNSVLTKEIVEEMKELFVIGDLNKKEICELYNISQSSGGIAMNGKTWLHEN